MAESTPAPQPFDGLAAIATSWLSLSRAILEKAPKETYVQPGFALAYIGVQPYRDLAQQAGMNLELVKQQLETILLNDSHLKACCGTPEALVYWLDRGFLSVATAMTGRAGAPSNEVLLSNFISQTYATHYARGIYFHLYNFAAPRDVLDFGDIRIIKLYPIQVRTLLGVPQFNAHYHPPGVGDFFIEFQDRGTDDLGQWFRLRNEAAFWFVRMLQYFKDGLTYIDYHVPFFAPFWVNQIHRGDGTFYVGSPRRVPYQQSSKFYVLDDPESDRIRELWGVYKDIIAPALSQKSAFRETTLRAGDFFESNFGREQAHERLLALAIALEALFSPSDKQEINFRIAQYTSQLVGTEQNRKEMFQKIRDVYDLRSQLVHASYDVDEFSRGTFVTHEQMDELGSIVRQALVRFTVLLIRGLYNTKRGRRRLHDELSLAALDPQVADELRRKSDPEVMLDEVRQRKLAGAQE